MSTPLDVQTKNVTRLRRAINARIGRLSSPSKMPGLSWSIPAVYCKTGKRLAQNLDSPCRHCYALRGRYAYGPTRQAMENRLKMFSKDRDWVHLISAQIVLHTTKSWYFRWFDSGDIQSKEMLEAICKVAELTEPVQHWLPTQERRILSDYVHARSQPKNLTIRVSSPVLSRKPLDRTFPTSSAGVIAPPDSYVCPSRHQGHQCGDCRRCWDPNQPHIHYPLH